MRVPEAVAPSSRGSRTCGELPRVDRPSVLEPPEYLPVRDALVGSRSAADLLRRELRDSPLVTGRSAAGPLRDRAPNEAADAYRAWARRRSRSDRNCSRPQWTRRPDPIEDGRETSGVPMGRRHPAGRRSSQLLVERASSSSRCQASSGSRASRKTDSRSTSWPMPSCRIAASPRALRLVLALAADGDERASIRTSPGRGVRQMPAWAFGLGAIARDPAPRTPEGAVVLKRSPLCRQCGPGSRPNRRRSASRPEVATDVAPALRGDTECSRGS